MLVALISVYEGISCYGLRVLSAVLKRAGFQTRLIFLPRDTEGLPWDGWRYPYPEATLDQLAELVADSGLIGISLTTNHLDNAVQITERLRRCTSVPVVWGGIHPTIRPEECLNYADIACVGEGEEATLQLVQQLARGNGYKGIANMWYGEGGQVVRTPLLPLRSDLDSFPYPDYDLVTSFVLHEGRIQPMTADLLLYYSSWPHASDSVPTYETMIGRGCSYCCTYCCNNALRRIYHGQWCVRRRSVGHVIGELQQAMASFPGFRCICITDDEFLSDMEVLREFCTAYPQAVGVPFYILGFQPPMADEERVGLLVDAGMQTMHMGIQTGSMRTMREVYHRPVRRDQIVRAVQVLSKFAGRLDPPYCDIIVDNPWETEQDQLETLALLLDLPRFYRLQLFSLTLYPGTELCERAEREGLLDEISQSYRKHYFLQRGRTYINGLFRLLRWQRMPRWLPALLMRDSVRRLNWVWLVSLINGIFRVSQLLAASWCALLRRDWGRFARNLRFYLGRRPKPYGSSGPPSGRQK